MRLRYLKSEALSEGNNTKAQPCVVVPDRGRGRGKPIRVVPITPLQDRGTTLGCVGCIAEHVTQLGGRIDCGELPNCDDAIYVRATPKNKLKYVEWLLDKHN